MIEILNFNENDLVYNTELVIIKGKILWEDDDSELIVTKGLVSDVETLYESSKAVISLPTYRVEKYFSTIVALCKGENVVRFVRKSEDSVLEAVYTLKLTVILDDKDYKVQPLLITVGSANQNTQNLSKINTGMKLAQAIFLDALSQFGHTKTSFTLKPCIIKQIRNDELENFDLRNKLDSVQLWNIIGQEIINDPQIWNDHLKYVAFFDSATKACSDNLRSMGSGGLALLPASIIHFWGRSLTNVFGNVSEGTDPPMEYCASALYNFASSLGSLVHELGHVFELGHYPSGVMGSEYSYIDEYFCPVKAPYPPYPNRFRKVPSISLLKRDCVNDPNRFKLLSHFYESAVLILAKSKWFGTSSVVDNNESSNLENVEGNEGASLQLADGITVIEVRSAENQEVLKTWTFYDRGPKKFCLKKNDLPFSVKNTNFILFAMDKCGKVLKREISSDMLSNGVTSIRMK